MTRKEMTEVFSVMMLAWPSAEMFSGGIQKLAPTIELWTICLPEVDFWTAQRVVVELCRNCKFPPTIAEFKKTADSIQATLQVEINIAFSRICNEAGRRGSLPAYYDALPQGNRIRKVIDALGGPSKIWAQDNADGWYEFREAYFVVLRNEIVMAINTKRMVGSCAGQGKES